MNVRRGIATLGLLLILLPADADAAGFRWSSYAKRDDAWFRGPEAERIAANVRSHQTRRGDWPKNVDTGASPFTGDRSTLKGTFDNGATVGEIRFLAHCFRATGRATDRDACLKGIDHVLAAQYPNGGWPQSFPPGPGYARHITFNDNTMVNLMTLARDVARSDDFDFAGDARRHAAGRAFDAAVACIVKCQIRKGGTLTAWCAQHDEVTFQPRGARAYELPSLSGAESGGIVLMLMSLDDPSPEVVRAIEGAVAWFESARLDGIRQVVVDGNKVIRRDPTAPPLWARFYDLETGRPFFCGRDGVKKAELSAIEPERRNGYSWYGDGGRKVAEGYATWKARRPGGTTHDKVKGRS